MNTFPPEVFFHLQWRDYQLRVLNELESHLGDGHLHIVAPPGSGKTILGLEVARRLNKPTLILAPTIAIRNQWIHRFCSMFLRTENIPSWISSDIRTPGFLTVATYQGLHAACNGYDEEEEENGEEEDVKPVNKHPYVEVDRESEIINALKSCNVSTIVVDEAHHLKNEWWNTLMKVKNELSVTIVGLTATPPYDVTASEWKRYEELNGPVDAEISVPELVKSGDLSPHQDYVYFTLPAPHEQDLITEFHKQSNLFIQELKQDEIVQNTIANLPAILNPMQELDWIYDHFSFYSASLIYLNAVGKTPTEEQLRVTGQENIQIPLFTAEWAEELMMLFLYSREEIFETCKDHRKQMASRLKQIGVLDNKQVSFKAGKKIMSQLTASISKLNAISEIAKHEYNELGDELRLVVLSDFICAEFLGISEQSSKNMTKVGVIPIFERLKSDLPSEVRLAVLTGSIVIIPVQIIPIFNRVSGENHPVQFQPLEQDDRFVKVIASNSSKHLLVHWITELFQQGELNAIVGTKSLLGEGWDAPAINTLILATFVGSFVLSNQMRGRAIRAFEKNPDKTGNIWHLVCIDKDHENGGPDLELLKRRCKSFVGISNTPEVVIQNGSERLGIPETKKISHVSGIENANDHTLKMASDRTSMRIRWKNTLETGNILIEELRTPFRDSTNRTHAQVTAFYFKNTIKNFLFTLFGSFMLWGYYGIIFISKTLRNTHSIQTIKYSFLVLGILLLVVFGPRFIKALRFYLFYRDISKDIKQIANVLVESLIENKMIKTPQNQLVVEAKMDKFGGVFCHLEGATTYEKSLFISCLEEIVSPVINPKYLIVRKNKQFGINQVDYHAVPELLSKRKAMVELYADRWLRTVGSCMLVYTRTPQGRKLLIESRMKSLSAQWDGVERINNWK